MLADAGVPAAIMRGFALIARCAGLVGHVHEEQRDPAMRAIWEAAEHAVPYRDPSRKARMTMTMKLYMHPVSTASRPVWLFIAENKLPVTNQVVDLMTGEHSRTSTPRSTRASMVPTLEDGDFRLTESSAILKYLASKFELPHYPTKDLKKRARVDETMDWINTQFYRDYGYGLLYPQMFPTHKRPTDDQQKGTIAWGKERAAKWFKVLDKHFLGKTPYLASDTMTIADYFGACIVATGEIIGCDFKGLNNVSRWLGSMKKLPAWNQVHEVANGFAGSLKDKKFETV